MHYFKKSLSLGLALLFCFNFALAQTGGKNKAKSKELVKVMEQHIIGLFNNRLQVEKLPEPDPTHGPQELRFVRVFPERKDRFYMFFSWASPATPDFPLYQRIIAFDWEEKEDGFIGTSYFFPAEGDYGAIWRNLSSLSWESFQGFEVDPGVTKLKRLEDGGWLWDSGFGVNDNPAAPFKRYQAFLTFNKTGIACDATFFLDETQPLFTHKIFYDLQSRKRWDVPFYPEENNIEPAVHYVINLHLTHNS